MSNCDNMFTNYNYINDNVIPNNNPKKTCSCNYKEPFANYNAKGDIIGYYWYFGNTVTLDFNITGEVVIEDGSIVYKVSGDKPDESTIGDIDQKAYNIIDLKAWSCVAIEEVDNSTVYTWVEIPFDSSAVGKSVYISAKDYLSDKKIKVQLYDFQHQPIRDDDGKFIESTKRMFNGAVNIYFNIDTDLSNKLHRGTYYCEVLVFDKNDNYIQTIFNQNDLVFDIR